MTTESDQGVGFSLVHPDEEAKSSASSATTVIIHQRNEARRRVAELEAWQQVARENYEDLRAALAAVTAERDQAVHDRDSWRRQLDEQATSTREEIERADTAEAQLDQARQKLADAPHTDICYYRQRQGDGCNCWKEEA